MFAEAVAKLAETGAGKARYLSENPLGFWISSMMAGIYVGFGILLIFSVGSALDPSVRPLAMGATFGLALILVVFAGADLYTGLTMSMPLAVLEGRTSWDALGRVWTVSWFGNFAGALMLAALFVLGGGGLVTSASSDLIYKVAAAKMNMDALPLLARAILCNWLVCLALWMSARLANETARMVAIAWCLLAFIASGYEHSIANMTIFAVVLFSKHPDTVTWAGMVWNLFWVTLGNTIAGALFMAGAYWLASKKPVAALAGRVAPAE
jgi:nitrite transporter NirC